VEYISEGSEPGAARTTGGVSSSVSRPIAAKAPMRMYWSGGPVVVASRAWFVSNFSGFTAFETEAGLVLVDSGTERLAPRLAAQLRKHTQAPVHTAIFTHGHLDHAYGLRSFLVPESATTTNRGPARDPRPVCAL
jgi:glyoxylase-like metal-dependent hydrolase (beta-lactamase superfamily II)